MKHWLGVRDIGLGGLFLAGCGGGPIDLGEPQAGDITTWAGEGTQGHDGDGNHRLDSWLNQPVEVAFSDDGLAYIADWNNHSIRRVGSDARVETLIGTPLPGDWPCQDPTNAARCDVPLDAAMVATELSLNHPTDVVPLPEGDLLIAAWHNHKIQRCVTSEQRVTVVAGAQKPGFAGDGGPAADALLFFPDSLVVDATGGLLVSDQKNNRIRRIEADGSNIATVAGFDRPSGYSGEGGPALQAELAFTPYDEAGGADNPPPGGGLALDAEGVLYAADTYNHCVRSVLPGVDGVIGQGDPDEERIDVVAGRCGERGYAGDGGPATEALFDSPHDLEIGPDRRLYIADVKNHLVRAVDLESGIVERIVGRGTPGFSGDGGPALDATLRTPYGIAFDTKGDLFVVDTGNNRIRRVRR